MLCPLFCILYHLILKMDNSFSDSINSKTVLVAPKSTSAPNDQFCTIKSGKFGDFYANRSFKKINTNDLSFKIIIRQFLILVIRVDWYFFRFWSSARAYFFVFSKTKVKISRKAKTMKCSYNKIFMANVCRHLIHSISQTWRFLIAVSCLLKKAWKSCYVWLIIQEHITS